MGHVPMRQQSFGAVVYPAVTLPAADGTMPARIENVCDRGGSQRTHSVIRTWSGWGTLAYPRFQNPSWSRGILVQVHSGQDAFPASSAGCQAAAQRDREQHLFGFVWTRDSGPDGHDASIFRRVQCQDVFPWFSSPTHVGDNSPP